LPGFISTQLTGSLAEGADLIALIFFGFFHEMVPCGQISLLALAINPQIKA